MSNRLKRYSVKLMHFGYISAIVNAYISNVLIIVS